MVLSTTLVTLTALVASAHAGVVRRHNFPVPPTYDAPHLENYYGYHIRYLALSCYTQHNTTFFDQCCHPLLKSEKLETARPAQCIPSASQSASASAALPSSTILPDGNGGDNGDDDEDCDDGDDEPETSSAAPATQPAPVNVEPAPTQEPTTTVQTSSAKPETSTAKATSTEAPKPTSTEAPKPTSTEKPKPAPTSTASKPAPTSSGGGILGTLSSVFSLAGPVVTGGIGTFFTQNGNAGNCGTVHQDSDHVIALPTNAYANGAHCGKKIGIIDLATGKTATGIVADSCPTCDNDQCLDLSTSLFNEFASPNQGTFNLAYAFID